MQARLSARSRLVLGTAVSVALLGALLAVVAPTIAPAADADDGPPHIAFLTPQISRLAGGTPFRIYGSGLLGTTSVRFGDAEALDLKVIDGGLVTATSPPAAAAGAAPNTSVTITVTDNEGSDVGTNVEDTRGVYYTDAVLTVSPSSGLHVGDTVRASITGYRPETSAVLVQAHPLLLFLEGGPDPASVGFGGPPPYVLPRSFTASTDANGNGTTTATLVALTGGLRYDPNITCPPNQETVNFGLDGCLIIWSQYAVGSVERFIRFADTPAPAPPTLTLSTTTAQDGDTIGLSGMYWNANPFFGSDVTPDDPGETPLVVELCNTALTVCAPAPASGTVELTRYRSSSTEIPIVGEFSGTNLDGSFTVGDTSGCAPDCVVQVRQEGYDYESYAGNGTGTFISATAPLSIQGGTTTTSSTTSTSTTSTTSTSTTTTSTTTPSTTTTTVPRVRPCKTPTGLVSGRLFALTRQIPIPFVVRILLSLARLYCHLGL